MEDCRFCLHKSTLCLLLHQFRQHDWTCRGPDSCRALCCHVLQLLAGDLFFYNFAISKHVVRARIVVETGSHPTKRFLFNHTTPFLTKGLEKSLCDFTGTIFVQCENPVLLTYIPLEGYDAVSGRGAGPGLTDQLLTADVAREQGQPDL